MRQIVLDTETTGLDPAEGHRIIEIGAVELINRRFTGRHYHQYLWPDREIDAGALQVHGITLEFLRSSPRFKDIATEFIEFVRDAELIIHNAPFDVGFLDHELGLLGAKWGSLAAVCAVTDSLALARARHPGQKNSLDALCKRYSVDNTQRTLHGALLDAEILADVYLRMTGGQADLVLEDTKTTPHRVRPMRNAARSGQPMVRMLPTAGELAAHEQRLDSIAQASGDRCVWRLLFGASEVQGRAVDE